MKRLTPRFASGRTAAALLAACTGISGCGAARHGGPGGAGGTAPRVGAATIAPLGSLVSSVAGPGWEVRTIVPPGTSAHVFEPRPSDVAALAPARLIVTVGAGYDGWIAKMATAGAARAELLDTSRSLGIGEVPGAGEGEGPGGHEDHDGHDGHGHGNVATDPHWWLSPQLAARALTPIAERFAALDPAGAAGYRSRAADEAGRILALDREIAAELAPARGTSFVSTHAGWTHFAARYGLVAAASIEPAPGRDPSPRQLRALIDLARSGGAGVIFTEPQFPERAARIVARDGGLEVVLVDPIGGVPGRSGYLETMAFNGKRFASVLSRRRGGTS